MFLEIFYILISEFSLSSVSCLLESALFYRRSTFVESPLQIHLFMQNKPNFRNAKMNIITILTKTYENIQCSSLRQNKPNQTQFRLRSGLQIHRTSLGVCGLNYS
jgi:hypothetical protein